MPIEPSVSPAQALDQLEDALSRQYAMAMAVVCLAGADAIHDATYRGKAAGIEQAMQSVQILKERLRAPSRATPEEAQDIREIVSSYGFLLMRLAVAADAQDTFDVCKREFTEHEAALKRLQDTYIHHAPVAASRATSAPREPQP